MAQSTPGVPGPRRQPRAPELLTPAQVAKVLGVEEADVIASLDSGDLKGKKIGTQWRVTRAAVDAFLQRMKRRARWAAPAERGRLRWRARRRVHPHRSPSRRLRCSARRTPRPQAQVAARRRARLARARSTSSTPKRAGRRPGKRFSERNSAGDVWAEAAQARVAKPRGALQSSDASRGDGIRPDVRPICPTGGSYALVRFRVGVRESAPRAVEEVTLESRAPTTPGA